MKVLLSAAAICLLVQSNAHAQAPAQFGDLFEKGAVLNLQVEYNISKLQSEKEVLRETGIDGRIVLNGVGVPVKVMPRGKGSFDCVQPQLKFHFQKLAPANSPFAGFGKVKLFTKGICLENKSDREQDKQILANYLIYKFAEEYFEAPYKTRLLKITYKDTSGKYKKYSQLGFFLEPEKHYENRTKMVRIEGLELEKLGSNLVPSTDSKSISMTNAFQYFIANFDYGIPGFYSHIMNGALPLEKNIHLYRNGDGKLKAVSFDFDISRFGYFGPVCNVAIRFFISEMTDYPEVCELSTINANLAKDLSSFRFSSDVKKHSGELVEAVKRWRVKNRAAIEKLGPNYGSGLDLFIQAFSQI